MAKNGICFYFFILACCLLVGCSRNSKNKSKIKSELSVLRAPFNQQQEEIVKSGMSKQHATSLLLMQNVHPNFADIPTPLGIYDIICSPAYKNSMSNVAGVSSAGKDAISSSSKVNDNNCDKSLSFKSKNNISYMVDFYLSQMERFGWKYTGQFSAGGEVLLNFVKPDKKSAISIRPYRSGVFVIIFSSHNYISY